MVSVDGDVKFIENLESLARENGLSIDIDSLNFEDNTKLLPNNMTIFRVRAKTSGNFFGTYKFLSLVESLPFKVKIQNFTLSTASEEGVLNVKKSNIWQSKFEISVLKYK